MKPFLGRKIKPFAAAQERHARKHPIKATECTIPVDKPVEPIDNIVAANASAGLASSVPVSVVPKGYKRHKKQKTDWIGVKYRKQNLARPEQHETHYVTGRTTKRFLAQEYGGEQQSCDLLKLPQEIRDIIYGYLINSERLSLSRNTVALRRSGSYEVSALRREEEK